MSYLTLTNLVKTFGTNTVVKKFNLSVEQGEFISLLGPSGCGKTTVLRMVAGFETPTDGHIDIDGQDITHLSVNARNIGMVFQSYALFPNLTVSENVAFGLRVKGISKSDRKSRVAEMLDLIGLPDLGNRFPFQLSGGQQQRVALARALAPKPRVLLLDEPLSALDAKIRVSLRAEIRAIQRELGITTIFVTHDQEEALSMSDRIVVMNGGIVDQLGTPFDIYNRPSTEFVANFVGTLNTFSVVSAGSGKITLGNHEIDVKQDLPPAGTVLTVAIRPEAVRLGPTTQTATELHGVVNSVEFLGSIIRLRIRVGDASFVLDTFNRADQPPPALNSTVPINLSQDDIIFLNLDPHP